ncbi:methylesterase 1-like [Carica papaya]|uniref:methylesterase 1-like n=1 Tax=Carica papaya TaxID=3649 RepID=UPI000B8C88E4|nr:methylesterase 1-like [Carica papaya]
MEEPKKHIVLVHGACHGAWCWHKVKPLLELAGHHVTVLDLAASGINMKVIEEVCSFREYTEPLLKLLAGFSEDEKFILVGHSLGGLNVAIAMEEFPHKISLAVYLTAFMPDTVNKPSFVLDEVPVFLILN